MAEITSGEKQNTNLLDLSIQRRTDAKAVSGAIPYAWWFVTPADTEISPWWSEQRDLDLREFWMREGNDILQGAVSSLVKKFKAMAWVVEGPERVVNRYQAVLAESEFGEGWGTLLGKVLTDYLTQDKGAFVEVLGQGAADGPIEGPALGLAHLDAGLCQLTGDPVYPVVFRNSKNGKPHKLHASRVIHIVDMPSPNEAMLGIGFCGVSRVIASSQVLLKLARYKNEKLSDLPEAGLLLFNNLMPAQWDDATAEHQRGRRKLGQEYWNNIITLFGLDPAQPVSAELISFANLPDQFNELEATNIYINIVALAFGVDAREFWPMSAGSLGTATEAEVMHQKAKGKGVGEIISMLERVVNWKVLPASVTFRFDFQDDEEDQLKAQIANQRTTTIMAMWQPPGAAEAAAGQEPPVSRLEIRQMLADNVDYFKPDFLEMDVTDETEATDTDQEAKALLGPFARLDNKGRRRIVARAKETRRADDVLAMAEQNYREGKISLDELIEFRLGVMLDGRE